MNLSKNFVSITLTAALVMGLMTSAFAVDTESNVLPHQLPNGVIESVKDKQIFRSYTPADNVLQFDGETISVSQLKTLGFPVDYIESLDAKTLSAYTHAKKIETTTTYYKTDYTNNTTEVISEEEANRLAAEANAAENSFRIADEKNYNILVIKAAAIYQGNDDIGKKYKFSTIVEWKTQPTFTQRDGIGTYVPKATITPNTGSIMLRCRKKTLDRTGHVVRDEAYSKQGTITKELATNCSCGGEVKLPTGGSALKYTDIAIYHGFEGHFDLNDNGNYNAVGSYLHQHASISINPVFRWTTGTNLPEIGITGEMTQSYDNYKIVLESIVGK